MGSCSETSQITVDSAEIVDAATSSFLDYTKWTNEKHSLYLKSMEASFVNELHCSLGLYRGTHEQKIKKKKMLDKDLFQQGTSFGDGVWKNISVDEYGVKSETRALMTNPWIRHFSSGGKHKVVEGAIHENIGQIADKEIESEKKENVVSGNNSRQSMATLSQQDSVDRNIEMSDQNFVDNNESTKSCRIMRGKRSRKTEANNNADSNQVVPKDLTATSSCKRMALNHRC